MRKTFSPVDFVDNPFALSKFVDDNDFTGWSGQTWLAEVLRNSKVSVLSGRRRLGRAQPVARSGVPETTLGRKAG